MAAVSLLLILAICGGACSRRADSAETAESEAAAPIPTVHVKVAIAVRGSIAEVVQIPGGIIAAPDQDVSVSSLVAGRILEIRAAEGEPVRQGQILALIDATPYLQQRDQAQASLQQAETALENARKDAARNRTLFDKGIAAGKELQDSEAQVRLTQAEVDKARAALETTQLQVRRAQIDAPLSGIVLRRLRNAGEQVSGTPSDPIMELVNPGTMEMEARIPSRHARNALVGRKLGVTTASLGDERFQGEIIAVGGAVDAATDSVRVRLRIRNSGNHLKIGMFAQGELVVQQQSNATLVPVATLIKGENQSHVYSVQGDTAIKKIVQVGIQNRDQAEIVSGVSPGDTLVMSGNYGLGETARVIVDK